MAEAQLQHSRLGLGRVDHRPRESRVAALADPLDAGEVDQARRLALDRCPGTGAPDRMLELVLRERV